METAITRNTQDLERLEGIITRNLQSFYEVGHALMEIRDRGYYREVLGFETFEAYCKAKWDFSRRNAYYLMEAASVIENVNNCSQIPVTESQARPLSKLEPAQQRAAWQQAVATAPDGKVTAAHVYKIVKGMTNTEPSATKEQPKPQPTIPEHAVYLATIAISQLERISADDPTREEAFEMVVNWINKHR